MSDERRIKQPITEPITEAFRFYPDKIAAQATLIANDALAYYSASTDQFEVEDSPVSKEGLRVIKISMKHGHNLNYKVPYQTLRYIGDTLVSVEDDNRENRYAYYSGNNIVEFGALHSRDNDHQSHLLRGKISRQEQRLTEITQVQSRIHLEANYTPASVEGEEGFEMDEISLDGSLPLLPEDRAKFLPNGRFISISDLLASAIDPYRSNQPFREKIPGLDRAEGFPGLGSSDIGPHLRTSVKLPGDVGKRGFAFPLENNPNGWLVFARFKKGDETIGRALLVDINRESVQVEDRKGIPTIIFNASVDGEQFSLELPEEKVRWEEKTAENSARAMQQDLADDGKTHVLVPMDVNQLRDTIDYYYKDMLYGVMFVYNKKYYPNEVAS